MSYESRAFVSYDAITALAGQYAAERDRDGQFPHSAFDDLRRLGLISQLPLDASDAAIPFRVLAAIGRGDAPNGAPFGDRKSLAGLAFPGLRRVRQTLPSPR